jgi:hypothetical protein
LLDRDADVTASRALSSTAFIGQAPLPSIKQLFRFKTLPQKAKRTDSGIGSSCWLFGRIRHTNALEANVLGEGIADTLVSADATSGPRNSVSVNASDNTQIRPRSQRAQALLSMLYRWTGRAIVVALP